MRKTLAGNIVANRSSDARSSTDFYRTPPDATQALLDFLNLPEHSIVLEPACGDGHIVSVLKSNGLRVIASDLFETSVGSWPVDFTSVETEYKPFDWLITNPPFSISEAFIRRALEFRKPFALLLKSQYWHSSRRLDLWQLRRPKYVLPLTWRPDFMFGERGGSPTMDCLWTVWLSDSAGRTIYSPLSRPM